MVQVVNNCHTFRTSYHDMKYNLSTWSDLTTKTGKLSMIVKDFL